METSRVVLACLWVGIGRHQLQSLSMTDAGHLPPMAWAPGQHREGLQGCTGPATTTCVSKVVPDLRFVSFVKSEGGGKEGVFDRLPRLEGKQRTCFM